jgi:hypothetical protein
MLNGRVTAMSVPQRGIEVLLVAGTRVRHVARTDADGRFSVDDADGVDRVVARFAEPFIGVVHQAVAAGPVEIDVGREAIARLEIEVAPPDGIPFDWVDIKLTPRFADLPPVVVLAAGTGSGLHEALWARRITDPRLGVRVLLGTWELRAARTVEGPLTRTPPINLTAGQVVLPDGASAPEQFRGFSIAVHGDMAVKLQLRPLRPEEQ